MTSLDFEMEKNDFREFYSSRYPLLKAAEDSFRALITSLLSGNPLFPAPVVTSRLKDREECIRKFMTRYQTVLEEQAKAYEIREYITDLLGVRVTCYYETDIPYISKILGENFEVLEITDKTSSLESRDDAFGYKGLHLDLRLNEQRRALLEYQQFQDFRFEVQIRTIIQHAWSELDHKIKYKKSPPAALKRKINRLAALFELADQEFVNIRIDTEEREKQIKEGRARTTQDSTEDEKLRTALEYVTEMLKRFTDDEDKFLDAFQFLSIAHREFPFYNFLPDRVDSFVQGIRTLSPKFTQSQLEEALDKYLPIVKRYADYQAENHFNLNPYTMLRHTLYMYDQSQFGSVLFDRQKENFGRWLAEHNQDH